MRLGKLNDARVFLRPIAKQLIRILFEFLDGDGLELEDGVGANAKLLNANELEGFHSAYLLRNWMTRMNWHDSLRQRYKVLLVTVDVFFDLVVVLDEFGVVSPGVNVAPAILIIDILSARNQQEP